MTTNLSQLLLERASDILFHYTSLYKAGQIASTNEFKLTPTFHNSSERALGSDKPFFLSTARSKLGSYARGAYATKNGDVVFKLDGRKFNERYEAKPVDYYGPSWRNMDATKHEMEDRIFSDDAVIPDANSYIIEAHVLLADGVTKEARRALVSLKTAGYPVYLYKGDGQKGVQDFILQDKRKAVSLADFNIPKATPDELEPSYQGKMDRTASQKSMERNVRSQGKKVTPRGLQQWFMLAQMPVEGWSDLPWQMKDKVKYASYPHMKGETVQSLEADMQSMKLNRDTREMQKISNLMKKIGAKTPVDMIDYIVAKFKDKL